MNIMPTNTPAPLEERIAQAFAALGSVPRLQLLRALLSAGPSGLTVGEIRDATGMPASTQFHHLARLQTAGLVLRQARGKEAVNHADLNALGQIARYLLADCCGGAAK